MSRKLLPAAVAVGAAFCSAIPAMATGDHGARAHARGLMLTTSFDRSALSPRRAVAAAPQQGAIVSYQGFSCEVTVGVGTDDQTPRNFHVTDSTEFHIDQTAHRALVTTNCIGTLPSGTVHSTQIVSHPVACRQFNPFHKNAPTVPGFGISTTFPDGMFSESCTSRFNH